MITYSVLKSSISIEVDDLWTTIMIYSTPLHLLSK
jgi:hypothetical protein